MCQSMIESVNTITRAVTCAFRNARLRPY